MRPPSHLVPIPHARWLEACAAWSVNPMVRQVEHDRVVIGWRAPRMWYVDPHAFKQATGFYPAGFVPHHLP